MQLAHETLEAIRAAFVADVTTEAPPARAPALAEADALDRFLVRMPEGAS